MVKSEFSTSHWKYLSRGRITACVGVHELCRYQSMCTPVWEYLCTKYTYMRIWVNTCVYAPLGCERLEGVRTGKHLWGAELNDLKGPCLDSISWSIWRFSIKLCFILQFRTNLFSSLCLVWDSENYHGLFALFTIWWKLWVLNSSWCLRVQVSKEDRAKVSPGTGGLPSPILTSAVRGAVSNVADHTLRS